MLISYKVYLITVILFKIIFLNDAQHQMCKTPTIPTPTELDGVCVSRSDCKVVYDIVKKNPAKIPPSILTYLIKADCGTFNGTRFLCCKIQYLSSEAREAYRKLTEEKSTLTLSNLRQARISDRTRDTDDDPIEKHPNIVLLPDECQVIQLSLNDRIANGDDAELNEFRFIALMQYEATDGSIPSFYCGGSLISSRYVLTAAHCVDLNGIVLKSVRLGEYNTETDPDCTDDGIYCTDPHQDIPVEEIIIHENFNLRKFSNDIALIRLAKPVNLRVSNVAPICLPIISELQNDQIENGIVIGWGSTEKRYVSSILQKASLSVVNRYKCRDLYRKHNIPLLDFHICAGGENFIDACRGDSGGPFISLRAFGKTVIPRFVQYGIVSGGASTCGSSNFPGLFTNVSYYTKWILDNIKE